MRPTDDGIKNEPMTRSLFILSSPRSGSSWFVDALAATGRVGNPDEFFRELNYFEARRRYDLPPEAPLDEILRLVSRDERTPNGVFAAKLMGRQLELLRTALWTARPEWEGGGLRRALETLFGPSVFVWLRRRDLLAQAISYVKAEQSGVWRMLNKTSTDAAPREIAVAGVFDPLAIALTRKEFEADNARIEGFLREEGIPFLELFYEDLVESLDSGVTQVLDLLGERPSERENEPRSPLRRQRDATNVEWRERFERWRQTLSPVASETVELRGRLRLLEANNGSISMVAKQPAILTVELESLAAESWPIGGDELGDGAVGVSVYVFNASRKEIFPQRRFLPLADPLGSGQSTRLGLFLGAIEEPGEYRLFLQLTQRNRPQKSGAPITQLGVGLLVQPPPNPKAELVASRNNGGCVPFDDYWGGEVRPMPFHFWCWQQGFGYFQNLGWPWMQHSAHGFWRFFGRGDSTASGWWWFDHVLGVCWSSSDNYPFIRAESAGVWLEFLGLEGDMRRFCRYPEGKEVLLPRSEPRHRISGGWKLEEGQ